MKKQILLLIISTFIIFPLTKATDFAPVGATWYYTEHFFMGFPDPEEDYIQFKSEKDTLIYGELCRKITKRHKILCNDRPDVEYVFTRNDTVFYFDNDVNDFQILYDFNAEKGDSWTVQVSNSDSITVVVDSIGQTYINGKSLKKWFVRYVCSENNVHHQGESEAVIVETIGDLSYLFNIGGYWFTPCDGNSSGGLRCYMDDEIGYYTTGISETCDDVISFYFADISDKGCVSANPDGMDTTYFWYRNDTLFVRNIQNELCGENVFATYYTKQNTLHISVVQGVPACLADCSYGYTLKIPIKPFESLTVGINHEYFPVVYNDIVNSVEDISKSKTFLYPNPVHDVLTVDVEELKSLNVYALSGQLVHQQIGNKTSLQLNHLDPGVYLVRVETLNGTYVQKIVKQ